MSLASAELGHAHVAFVRLFSARADFADWRHPVELVLALGKVLACLGLALSVAPTLVRSSGLGRWRAPPLWLSAPLCWSLALLPAFLPANWLRTVVESYAELFFALPVFQLAYTLEARSGLVAPFCVTSGLVLLAAVLPLTVVLEPFIWLGKLTDWVVLDKGQTRLPRLLSTLTFLVCLASASVDMLRGLVTGNMLSLFGNQAHASVFDELVDLPWHRALKRGLAALGIVLGQAVALWGTAIQTWLVILPGGVGLVLCLGGALWLHHRLSKSAVGSNALQPADARESVHVYSSGKR